jgi:glycerol-3-phosphate dehydrogenase
MQVDIAIIGGGINGCGIARDAAGRGLSIYLCEQNDLASGTSSWSTKLIHGGLRYLEHYEFRLVREALIERERLWRLAPHIISPLRFVLPAHRGLRPSWMLRLGLFLYDHLGGRKLLPATRTLNLLNDEAGRPLKPDAEIGFEYSDCSVDDSRLVVLNAMDARAHGAVIETRQKLIAAERINSIWRLTIEDQNTKATKIVEARALVNAAGPWVADILEHKVHSDMEARVRLVQGSHIVLRRLYNHDRAYIFQNADGRIIFAIPYQKNFTLIGTTDRDYKGDPADVRATEDEITYLIEAASEYFKAPLKRDDVVWSFSGVRPLYDDGASKAQEATRDYVLKLDAPEGKAPLLSVFGGKITTYRRLAEAVLDRFKPQFAALSSRIGWTADDVLPGGNFPVTGFATLVDALSADYPNFEPSFLERLCHLYGTCARDILGTAQSMSDLGQHFGGTLTERELDYLISAEWAQTAEDVLWRRTKLGLILTKSEQDNVATAMLSKRQ